MREHLGHDPLPPNAPPPWRSSGVLTWPLQTTFVPGISLGHPTPAVVSLVHRDLPQEDRMQRPTASRGPDEMSVSEVGSCSPGARDDVCTCGVRAWPKHATSFARRVVGCKFGLSGRYVVRTYIRVLHRRLRFDLVGKRVRVHARAPCISPPSCRPTMTPLSRTWPSSVRPVALGRWSRIDRDVATSD